MEHSLLYLFIKSIQLKIFFIGIFFLLLSIGCACAQDPHFSQFYASPLTLNPAYTGKFDGAFRLEAIYRNQWPSIPNAYNTAGASVDFGILRHDLFKGDLIGIGFSGIKDQSADGAIDLNYASVSFAYHKSFDEDGYNTLGIGFQATTSSINVNLSRLTFEDQILNFRQVSAESERRGTFANGTSETYVDLNTGILFSGSSDGQNNYYGGFSFYHINTPVIGFKDKTWKLTPRITTNAGGTFLLNEQYALCASFIEQFQNEANEFVLGTAVRYAANTDEDNTTYVYAGSWYRVGDALIPYIGLEFSGLRLGASYDINLSSLKAATLARGGAEFSLIYIKKIDEDKPIPCPTY
jgi:type IX secretion system PorP/SprF family membrane protein